jgi:hypothetical protein
MTLSVYRWEDVHRFFPQEVVEQYRKKIIEECQRQEVSSQIAEYATPSIWGNPTVICVGSNAEV